MRRREINWQRVVIMRLCAANVRGRRGKVWLRRLGGKWQGDCNKDIKLLYNKSKCLVYMRIVFSISKKYYKAFHGLVG